VAEGTAGLRLRPASGADAAAVAALHADSWRRHYRGAFSDAYLDGDLDADRLAVWTARLDSPDPDAVTLLAELAGSAVGFVHVMFEDDPRWGALIDNLHVRHDLQRHGVGRRLMSAAAREVSERSPESALYLWVLQQNERAQSFYRAIGGTCADEAPCEPPGGRADRLCGAPLRLRFVWPAASDVAVSDD
jgi:ribosomal protein S18 acetylase RimI-like enzyme